MRFLLILLLIPLCAFAQRAVTVGKDGRIVYPELKEFIAQNNLATKDELGSSGSDSGGSNNTPLVIIPMEKSFTISNLSDDVICVKPTEFEVKVKVFGEDLPRYWFSTLKDENYLGYAKRDVDARAWFTTSREDLAIGDNRDWFLHIPEIWNGLSDQLTDITLGVHRYKLDDISGVAFEPNTGGRFADGTIINSVWQNLNSELFPTVLRISPTGKVGSWLPVNVSWSKSKKQKPRYEYQLDTTFISVEDSAYWKFDDKIEYLGGTSEEVLFTSSDKIFDVYGTTIIAFTVEFPEFKGSSCSIGSGILNRFVKVDKRAYTVVRNENVLHPLYMYWGHSDFSSITPHTEVFLWATNDNVQSRSTYYFDGNDYSNATARIVFVANPYDNQSKVTYSMLVEGITGDFFTATKTLIYGSPTYNILGVFAKDLPAGTKFSNFKIITYRK